MDRTDTESTNDAATGRAPCVSMHEGTETWDDLCICEPEPRWAAAAEELGIET